MRIYCLAALPGDGSEEWTLNPLAEPYYDNFQRAVRKAGLTNLALYYDWRRTPNQTAAYLSELINANTAEDESVYLVGHSFGGLVSRALIEQRQTQSRVAKLLTAGTPHRGTPIAYYVFGGGKLMDDNLLLRFALETLVQFCGAGDPKNTLRVIRTYAPSMQQLLPTFDYLEDMTTGTLKPVSSQLLQNSWLPNTFFDPPYYDIPVGTLSGTGYKTLSGIVISPPLARYIRNGVWVDGKPESKKFSYDGDGTILGLSSQLPGANNRTMPLKHSILLKSKSAITAIFDFFGIPSPFATSNTQSIQLGEPLEPLTEEEPTTDSVADERGSALVIMAHPADFTVTKPDGASLADRDGIVAVMKPSSDTYTVYLTPSSTDSAKLVVSQLLRDGRSFWSDMEVSNSAQRVIHIIFDASNPLENPLQ